MDIKLGVFTIIAFIILLILLAYSSIVPAGSFLDRYTEKFNIVSGFFIGFGLYLTFMIFSTSKENFENDLTYKIIDRGWINVNLKLSEYYDKCPNFIESLYFPWQKTNPNYGIVTPKYEKNDLWYVVNYLSILIFQSFEDFLTANQNDETGHEVWICNFIQWVNSPILEDRWNVLKSNYAQHTIDFVDLLFKDIKYRQINNTDDIRKLAFDIKNSPEYQNIIYTRNLL